MPYGRAWNKKNASDALFYITSSAQQQYGPALDYVKNSESIPQGKSSNESKAIETLENTQKDSFKVGQENLISGYIEDAIAYFDKAIQKDPKNMNAFEWRGYAHFINGNWDLALQDFNQYIEQSPIEKSKWLILWRWASQSKAEGIANADNALGNIIQTRKVSDQWWNQMASALIAKKSFESMLPETKKSDPRIEKGRKLDVLFYMGLIPNIASGAEDRNESILRAIGNLGNFEFTEQYLALSMSNKLKTNRTKEASGSLDAIAYKNLGSFLDAYESLLRDKLILPDFEKKITPLAWSDAALTKHAVMDPKEYLEAMRVHIKADDFVQVSELKKLDYTYDNIITELESTDAPWKKSFLDELSDPNNYVKICRQGFNNMASLVCASGIVVARTTNRALPDGGVYSGKMAEFIPRNVIINIQRVSVGKQKRREIIFTYLDNKKLVNFKIDGLGFGSYADSGSDYIPRFDVEYGQMNIEMVRDYEYQNLFSDFIFLANVGALSKSFEESKVQNDRAKSSDKLMGISGLSWGSSAKETMMVVRGQIPLNLYKEPIIKTFTSSVELLADKDTTAPSNLFNPNGNIANEVYLAPIALLSFLEVSSGGMKLPFPLTIILLRLKSDSTTDSNGKQLPGYVFSSTRMSL